MLQKIYCLPPLKIPECKMRFCLGNSRGKTTWKAANLQKGRLICQYVFCFPRISRDQLFFGEGKQCGQIKSLLSREQLQGWQKNHKVNVMGDHELWDESHQLWGFGNIWHQLTFCSLGRRLSSLKECELFQTRINFDPRARLQIKLSSRCCEHGQGVPKLLKASLRQITL